MSGLSDNPASYFEIDDVVLPTVDDLLNLSGRVRIKDHGLSVEGDRVVDVICDGSHSARTYCARIRDHYGFGTVEWTRTLRVPNVVRVVWTPEEVA